MSTYDPAALECLAAIVEEGGFERAAQRLNVTQSAVSQRLRALEAQVGSVLIVQPPAQAHQRGAVAAQAHQAAAPAARRPGARPAGAGPQRPGGSREDERISIAINADSIATWAMGALHDLVRQRLPLEIITDDQDFTQEWLRSGQVLGCVTTLKSRRCGGCKMVPLGAMHYVAVASADFARKHLPQGLTPHNFRDVSFLSFNRKDDMAAEFVARTFGLKRVALNHLFVPSTEGQMRAVSAGWGVGVMPELLARGPIADGSLVDLVPGHFLPIQLYWHCWNLESELLDALTEALKATAANTLVT